MLQHLWNWYADQCEMVKAPKHGAAELLALSEGRWMADPQFGALVTQFVIHGGAASKFHII